VFYTYYSPIMRRATLCCSVVLAMALRLSVCLSVSVTSRSSAIMAKQFELVFGMDASLHLSYSVL